jgi:hypothetical protein
MPWMLLRFLYFPVSETLKLPAREKPVRLTSFCIIPGLRAGHPRLSY